MSDGFFVDPDRLVSAVDGADDAVAGLQAAGETLLVARDHLECVLSFSGLGPSVRHKAETFTRQWRQECFLIALHTATYSESLRQVAAAYRQQEGALTEALESLVCGSDD